MGAVCGAVHVNLKDTFGGMVMLTEEQKKLLEKALALYSFTIEQRRNDNYDNDESNQFFEMVERLSEIVGCDLEY